MIALVYFNTEEWHAKSPSAASPNNDFSASAGK
jgi:hypothetical protein